MTAGISTVSAAFPAAGLESARPTSGVPIPAFYSATDTGVVWRSDDGGATWAVWALALPEGTADGDVPVWDATAGLWVPGTGGGGGGGGAISYAKVYNAAGTSIPNSAATVIPWPSEEADTAGYHDPAVNNTRLTAIVAGLYRVSASLAFVNGSAVTPSLWIRLNGVTDLLAETQAFAANSGLSRDETLVLAAGDYVEAVTFQSSGAARALRTDAMRSTFTIVRLA